LGNQVVFKGFYIVFFPSAPLFAVLSCLLVNLRKLLRFYALFNDSALLFSLFQPKVTADLHCTFSSMDGKWLFPHFKGANYDLWADKMTALLYKRFMDILGETTYSCR
jgi:hypothetical protein